MKSVFVQPHFGLSRAMDRVAAALAAYAPKDIEIVSKESDADIVVLHVIGFPETVMKVLELKEKGQKYAIIQYCLRSTQEEKTGPWLPLWEGAEVVWSYYDLIRLMAEDGVIGSFNFYDAPMGADPKVFTYKDGDRIYKMFTSGYVAETECVTECTNAVADLGGLQFHLGPNDVAVGKHVTADVGIPDPLVARMYQHSEFVAGLRRKEGFELPALEGLLCGARPIMFDGHHYRRWFDDYAILIPESDPESVTKELVRIMREPKPVSEGTRNDVAAIFNWKRIIDGFWEAL